MAIPLIRATLRRLHSPDALDLRSFEPADPTNFSILVQALIGPAEAEGEEAFDFVLCTPQWMVHELQTTSSRWGRGTLVIERYTYEIVERAVQALCRRAVGSSWPEVAALLNRWMMWEFQDYQEARGGANGPS